MLLVEQSKGLSWRMRRFTAVILIESIRRCFRGVKPASPNLVHVVAFISTSSPIV